MTRFIYDRATDRMVDKDTGEPMVDRSQPLQTPMVMSDLPGYRSPVDGSWIEGKRARRYDLEKNNCIDANDLPAPKRLKNERFAKKHGLERLME